MVTQLEVTVKDEERRLKRDFLIYEPFQMSEDDDTIKKCLQETIDEFKGIPDDVKVKALMVFQ